MFLTAYLILGHINNLYHMISRLLFASVLAVVKVALLS